MKIFNLLSMLILALLLSASACNSKKAETTDAQTTGTQDAAAVTADPNAAQLTTNTNEPHYKCPKNCPGSGGDAKGTCPVCGSEYVHNQAYHSQTSPEGTVQNPIQINNDGTVSTPSDAAQTSAGTTPTEPPSAQNAKGEWHFKCSKSCGGGAATQGTCPKCGAELAHNQAYHQ